MHHAARRGRGRICCRGGVSRGETGPIKFSVFLGTNPIQEVERLRAMIRSGTVERLVLGGHVYGGYKWAITKMSAELKTFDNRGNCWAANTTLSLKEYARR